MVAALPRTALVGFVAAGTLMITVASAAAMGDEPTTLHV